MVTAPDYNALFHEYLGRATHHALNESHQADSEGGTASTATLLHTLTLALQSPDHWQDARDLLFHLHSQMDREGRYADWDRFLRQGIARSEAMGDATTLTRLQIYLGNLYRLQGKSAEAIPLFHAALTVLANSDDLLWYARACNGLAWTVRQQGQWQEALEWVDRALASVPRHEVNEQGASYRIRGGVAMERRDWQPAYDAFAEGLRLWRIGGDPRFIAFGLQNLGSALRALQNYEEAEATLLEAVDYFDKVGDLHHGGITRISVGNLHLMLEQFPRAIEHYYLAERIFRHANDAVRLAGIYNNWGMAYAGLQEWTRAERVYRQSIALWEQTQDKMSYANAMDNLSIALYEMGQYAESASVCRAALAVLEGSENPALREELLRHLSLAEAAQGL